LIIKVIQKNFFWSHLLSLLIKSY